jgi:outer membrane protein TolC
VAPLKAQAEVALNQLAVLTGRAPGDLDADLAQAAPLPVVPAQVAVGDPATLIAHRPDIRVAERALAASTAQVGVAKAKMFPSISFMGILGLGGTSPDDMIDPSKLLTLAMPQVKWSALNWGRTQAGIRQSKAERDMSEAQYRRAVLGALEDAESSLSRFGSARVRLAHLLAGEDAARPARRWARSVWPRAPHRGWNRSSGRGHLAGRHHRHPGARRPAGELYRGEQGAGAGLVLSLGERMPCGGPPIRPAAGRPRS